MSLDTKFPNGLSSYLETYYEIVTAITESINMGDLSPIVTNIQVTRGRGGLYELAEDLTDAFERLHYGETWEELDFFDTIDEFINENLYEKINRK